jgi:hypothetical protein
MTSNPPVTKPKPDIIDERIQFVIQFLIDGCDAPITVWCETFWQAFQHLVLQWYAIDLLNVFKAWLAPGTFAIEGRSNRHWGGGKKGKRKGPWQLLWKYVGFDPGEWLGEQFWGHDELRARPLPPGASYLWIFEGVIERFLWYCMVLDLVTDFAYRWSSAMVETKYCQMADDPILLAECGPYPLLGIFGWDTQGAFHPLKMRHIDFFNSFGVSASGGMGSAGGTAIISMPDPAPPTAEIETRMRVLLGPQAGRETYSKTTIAKNSTVTVGAGLAVYPGDLVIFEIRVNAGMTMEKAHLFYQQRFVTFE